MTVTEILSTGKENALQWQRIAGLIGVNNRRGVYEAIARERKNGALILPDNHGGYYLPDESTAEGMTEIRAFSRRMMKMSGEVYAATETAMRAAEKGLNDNG